MKTNAQFLLEELGHVEAIIAELDTQISIADTALKAAKREESRLIGVLKDMGEF